MVVAKHYSVKQEQRAAEVDSLLVAGIDEAGRGSVIGPLVIAGVLVEKDNLKVLVDLGVRDSKCLSPRRREILAEEIKRIMWKHSLAKLQPKDIDRVVIRGRRLHRLNRLEARTMAQIIGRLHPNVVYVDAVDVLEDRFRQHIEEYLNFKVRIISRHKADKDFPIVSAASILAKVERDREIEKLKEIYGDFGCGYPTDPKVAEFLEQCLRESGTYPDCVRKSWKTARMVKNHCDPGQGRLI